MGWCVFLIIIATFTQLDFSHYVPGSLNPADPSFLKLKHCVYIPQIPVIFFIAALIGKRFGITAALGGGIGYIFQYNFGYILAYLPAIFIVAFTLKDKFNFLTIAKASLLGVLTIHIIGVFYLILMAIIHQDPFSHVAGWISMQSGAKMIYDFVFGYFAILLAKPVKQILWLSMG